MLVLSLVLLLRSFYYCSLKVSEVHSSVVWSHHVSPTLQIPLSLSNSSCLRKHSVIIRIHLVITMLANNVLSALQCILRCWYISMKCSVCDDFFSHVHFDSILCNSKISVQYVLISHYSSLAVVHDCIRCSDKWYIMRNFTNCIRNVSSRCQSKHMCYVHLQTCRLYRELCCINSDMLQQIVIACNCGLWIPVLLVKSGEKVGKWGGFFLFNYMLTYKTTHENKLTHWIVPKN